MCFCSSEKTCLLGKGAISMKGFNATSLIVISAVALSACQPTRTAYHAISKDELGAEKKIQQQMLAEKKIDKQYKNEENRLVLQKRLNRVSKPIAKAGLALCEHMSIPANDCLAPFVLAENGGVNAWADGEKITIAPAMMNFAKSDEELALVLGHELAHHNLKHVAVKKTNITFASFVGQVADKVAGKYGVTTGGGIREIGTMLGSLTYSKSLEREADYVGLYITQKAGFDITNSPNFWRRMSMRDEKGIYAGVTHPTNPERFVALSKTVDEIKNKIAANDAIVPTLAIKSASNQ
jgi:predicted Zn-dependent protease